MVLAVLENLAEQRLFFKLEQKYIIQKRIANNIIAIFNFIKHRTISHNYVNENVDLQNVPHMQPVEDLLNEIKLHRLDEVPDKNNIEAGNQEEEEEQSVSVFM